MMPGDEQGSRAPWERLLPADGRRGETDVAFAAFCAYCNSPEGEDSIRGLVKSLPSCRTLLERWSLRHRWRQRRSAWRDHLAGIAREEIERLEREKTAEAKKRREQETKEQLEDVQLLRRCPLCKIPDESDSSAHQPTPCLKTSRSARCSKS